MSRYTFPKSNRLLSPRQFDAVFATKIFEADQTLVINAASNGLEHSRLGLSIGRKVGNAVVRNDWKRRIREAFRLQQHELPPGLDIVVRPRKDAVCNFDLIAKSLVGLSRRLAKKL